MLVAAAVCPHPPVLVPAVATGAADELADLRACCLTSVRRLVDVSPDRLVVVGGGPTPGEFDGAASGTLAAYGVDVSYGGTAAPELPLSLTVGCYLLDEVGGLPEDRRSFVAVTDETSAADCAAIGARVVSGTDRVALLVMGDGSAKRTTTSPGYVDERAIDYDDWIVNALDKGDCDTLLDLAPALARELWVAGRPAWQVLAGAGRAAKAGGGSLHGEVRYDGAPYGVGYAVVDWTFSYA